MNNSDSSSIFVKPEFVMDRNLFEIADPNAYTDYFNSFSQSNYQQPIVDMATPIITLGGGGDKNTTKTKPQKLTNRNRRTKKRPKHLRHNKTVKRHHHSRNIRQRQRVHTRNFER